MLSTGLEGDVTWVPSAGAISGSTTSRSKPLRAPKRMQRSSRPDRFSRAAQNVGTMDVFTVLSQVNEQLSKAFHLTQLLGVVVGIIQDLTQFHCVLVYQFDEAWNGQVRSRTGVSTREGPSRTDTFPTLSQTVVEGIGHMVCTKGCTSLPPISSHR